ncbi:MAG: M20 family metallopeptidase [Verrucomicrobiae bacterium]|nr:M20 family metallopeptidase [Verrucomicrobiae bacterium]
MKLLLQQLLPEIIELRHHLHAHPELAHEEHETAALVGKTLKKFGYEVTEGIGGTGVSAVLDSGKPGKTVALRADMDALPIHEETDLAHRSTRDGKMHACGHDGHTATLLAAAGALMQCKDQFQGKIKFIFQPAEETGTGAAAMIEDGVLENPKVDAIFGYHNSSKSDFGVFKTKMDCLFASQDVFTVVIHGKGGHAAYPHLTVDPIYIGSMIIQALQGIVSRCSAPVEPVVLSVTQFHAGNTHNVIPSEATF